MRTNWCTALRPPSTAWSSTTTWPARVALLAITTWSPIWQSCAMWTPTMNSPLSPTRVTMPPPVVPGFIVTCSRIVLLRPMTRDDFSPRYLRSCGSRPIEAKGKMRVPSPTVVRPSITTWATSRTPAPSTTDSPTTQYGPITTSPARLAPGATIAVGWICAIARLIVEDHRREHRLGGDPAADLGAPLELPDVAAVALFRDMHVEAVARGYRTAEAGIVDAHEIHQLAFRFRPQRMDDEHRGGLPHRPLVGNGIDHLVDQQKRMPVRDHLHDPRLIDLGVHFASRFLARRCNVATSFMNWPIGTAGLPQTVAPAGTSRISPALAAIRAPSPIVR